MEDKQNQEIFRLRSYQEEAVAFLLTHRRAILGDEPGTGKTPTALVALRQAGPWRSLIVCPKTVIGHWRNLAGVWYPELQIIDGTGGAARRAEARARVAEKPERPTALLLNFEAMRTDVEALAAITWGALIADEAHRLKSRGAQVTKAANALAKHPRMWCWLLTGTPVPNRPEEAWSLLHLCDRHRFSSYWRWVETHCELEPIYRAGRPVEHARAVTGLKDGALERIRAELADVLLYRSLEELLPHLPPVTFTTITVTLDATERRIHDDLMKRFWAEVGDGTVLRAPNVLARTTRLRQLVSDIGIFTLDGGIGSKVAAAAEIIGDLNPHQVVALTWSRAAAEALAAATGGDFIHGGITPADRTDVLRKFSTGTIRVLVGTTATLGEGVDGMQVAHHLVRLDRDWTLAKNTQGIARIRRSGQSSDAVFVIDIVAADSIDEIVERALRRKEDVIGSLLRHAPTRTFAP